MKAPNYIIICLFRVAGVMCQYDNDWKCKDAHGVCGETRSCKGQIWPNMCPHDKPYCCTVNSTAEDVYCIKSGGHCTPENHPECRGFWMAFVCAGSRWCCHDTKIYTYDDDSKCIAANGTCSDIVRCNTGRIWPNLCPKRSPYCCINDADILDTSCILMGGYCATKTRSSCDGTYWPSLCRPTTRECCVKKNSPPNTSCILMGGYCATKTDTPCDGTYWPSLCGRSTTRECCVKKNSPPNNDLKCKNAHGVCSETKSCHGRVWPNMCPLDKPHCCIVNSTAEDLYCIKIGGYCYEPEKEICAGFPKPSLCARPNSRQCCIKEEFYTLPSRCIAAKGTCSFSTKCDNGRVWPKMCPERSPHCCIKDADVTDVDCTLMGGYCATKTDTPCDGTYWPSLCGRSTTRECCIKKGSPPSNDKICTTSKGACVATTKCEKGILWPRMCPVDKPHCCVENSRRQDIHCVENGGYCVRLNDNCDGELWPSLCDDESLGCCIKDSISTDIHCVENGGYCVRFNDNCDGELWPSLCDDESLGCCIKDSISTEDESCHKVGGACRDVSVKCRNGEYVDGKCADEPERKCCVLYKNVCFSNPCENGGTCHAASNGFACECPWNHHGDYCEIERPIVHPKSRCHSQKKPGGA